MAAHAALLTALITGCRGGSQWQHREPVVSLRLIHSAGKMCSPLQPLGSDPALLYFFLLLNPKFSISSTEYNWATLAASGERTHIFLLTNIHQKRPVASYPTPFSRASPSRMGAGLGSQVTGPLQTIVRDRNQNAVVPGDSTDHFIPCEMKWDSCALTH